MNTESRVFNKLAEVEKVELATQKVELGVIQELVSLNNKIDKFLSNAYSDFNPFFDKINSKAKTNIKEITNLISKTESKIAEVKKMEKELGVTVFGKGTTKDLETNLKYMKGDVLREMKALSSARMGKII
tara:strand:- start:86 stop:475 length:390 start_codon:yes stop_codon:yes gene_type:complete